MGWLAHHSGGVGPLWAAPGPGAETLPQTPGEVACGLGCPGVAHNGRARPRRGRLAGFVGTIYFSVVSRNMEGPRNGVKTSWAEVIEVAGGSGVGVPILQAPQRPAATAASAKCARV